MPPFQLQTREQLTMSIVEPDRAFTSWAVPSRAPLNVRGRTRSRQAILVSMGNTSQALVGKRTESRLQFFGGYSSLARSRSNLTFGSFGPLGFDFGLPVGFLRAWMRNLLFFLVFPRRCRYSWSINMGYTLSMAARHQYPRFIFTSSTHGILSCEAGGFTDPIISKIFK